MNDDLIPLQALAANLKRQSWGYKNLTGVDLAPVAWTPAFTFATPGDLTVAYSVQVGTYVQLGKLIIATMSVTTSTFTHTTAAGNFTISGLPFASANYTSNVYRGTCDFQGITKVGYTNFVLALGSNSTSMVIAAGGSAQARANVASGDMPTLGTVIINGTIAYMMG